MPQTSFLSVPPDVLNKIALQTVYQSCATSGFVFRLRTLSSLLLLCRDTYANLSPLANPYLYGKIFRLLFDLEPIQRRLGMNAVRSAILTLELQRRLSMLKRLKSFLCQPNHLHQPKTMVSDLIVLLFMLTENDGKNAQQIRHMLGVSGVADLCTTLLTIFPSPFPTAWERGTETKIRSLVTVIMWVNPEDVFEHESADKTEAILDILEPLAVQSWAHSRTSVVNFTYFDLSGLLVLSGLAYTRLCIAQRYDAIKRRQSNSLFVPPSRAALTSSDIDADFSRLTRFHPDSTHLDRGSSHMIITTTMPPRLNTFMVNSESAQGTFFFETEWTGGWFVPNLSGSSIFTVYQPMKFRIRAYSPSGSNGVVQFVENEDPGDEESLTKAWFNEGVKLWERVDSLSIFDPITGRTSFYEPRSFEQDAAAMVDIILCGETTTAQDGDTFGDFLFHGRIRSSDGKIALVRKPIDPSTEDLGVWIFQGYLYGGYNFVGDWRNTSTAKDAPGGNGWFRFVKD